MRKRIFALALAIVMFLQTMTPVAGLAKGRAPKQKNMVKVGDIDMKSYPQPSLKIIQEANRRKKQQLQGRKIPGGAQLFSAPYFPNQDPTDSQKPLIFANVNAIFKTKGLDGGKFDWEGVFGKDADGKPNKAQIVFEQMDDKTSTRTGVKFFLKVDKAGKYTWSDSEGKPTKLPLYSTDLKPYRYEVLLDEDVSEHVKLLTARFFGTGGGYAFGKPDPVTGEIVGHINLDLTLQQIASTKFTSKWNTGVVEADRPTVEGSYLTGYEADPENYGIFKFPSNDTDKTIIRNDKLDPQNPGDYSEYLASELDKTPKVGVADPDPDATDTYTLDRDNAKISYKNKTYKYEVKYDVINGGKLTMTEVIPVTFDANGGKFASVTDPSAEQKIKKEVDYDGTLIDKAENPTKDRETFKGWSTTADGKTPATDADFKNITKAKTFYAIWDNNDIVAEQLEVKESFKDGADYVNDFIPKIADLKKQVKIKDASGTPQALTDDDKLQILDDSGNPIADADLKDKLYEKLKEDDGTEVSRKVTLKARVTHKNKTTQDVEIPIKVIKNIYEAKTGTKAPDYVPDTYVKVTVDPTTKAEKPQKYFYYVNPAANVVIPGKDPVGTGNNQFTKWLIKGTTTEYKLADKPRHKFGAETTIEAQYVSDVIPQDGTTKPDTVPANFVEVKFVPTDKATDETKAEKIYWVNPEKEVTIPVKNPVGKQYFTFKEWKMGANADGATYTPSTAQKFTEPTTVITATYDEAKNIIPYNPEEPITRPDGYVRVTFAAETGLKLTEQKAYYVKQNAKDEHGTALTLASLAKPTYEAQTGYKFDKWDKEDTTVIGTGDIVVTAKATKLDTVIPEKKEDGTPNEKPEGYKEVTFVIKEDDKTKGSITGVAKFFVNPNEYVTINPPATKANTGYEFGTWDKDASIPTVYDKDATITGSFNGLKDVIPNKNPDGMENKQPAGYKTVTFVIDPATGGKIQDGEVTVYYVNPAKEVTVPQPKTIADTGYEFGKWDQDTTTAKKYDKDTTVKGNFKKLDDIIPSTNDQGKPNAKPEGYITVTFDKGEHGTLSGQSVYYLNPKADPTKKLGDESIVKPTVKAETGYKFTGWDTKDDVEIKDNKTVIAQYEERDDVIPKTKQDESEKPEGYIAVKFSTEKNGKIKGSDKTEKIVYVNKNKAVALDKFAPTVDPNTGFDFADWDTQIEKKIQYNDGDTIKALYNAKDDVIPQEKTDGSDKPADYLTVTFDKGKNGTLSGKTVYYVKPNKEVTVPAPDVKPSVGYEFEKWDKELTQTFAEDTKITAQYKERDNIIPQGKPDGSDRPDGYHTVTFKPDANGSLSGKTVYYVKPNTDIDLTNTANTITKNPNVGYTAEGGTWSPAIASKKYTADASYTFAFKPLADAIEKIDESTKKPDGYVTVKLIPTNKATAETKAEKIYFVNPTKEVTITNKPEGKKEIKDGIEYTYNFSGWKVTRGTIASWTNEKIIGTFKQETEITAQYTMSADWKDLFTPVKPKDNVVTPKDVTPKPEDLIGNPFDPNDPDNKNNLPRDIEITYKEQPKVDSKGKTTAKVEVKYPNGKIVVVEVPITVVDNVVPQLGKDKPNVPADYVKVTFVIDPAGGGKIVDKEITTYYVNPAKEVTVSQPKTKADTGYSFAGWNPNTAQATKYERDTTVKGSFTKGTDIIPSTNDQGQPNTKPEGYVTVTFDKGANGSLDGKTVYYVNPNANKTLADVTHPTIKPNTGFTENGWDKEGTTPITGDITVTAQYSSIADVIPKENPTGGENKKPDGYITVTFKQGAHGTLQGTTVFYLNPNKAVALSDKAPTIIPDKGYSSAGWNVSINKAIQYKDGDKITARYNDPGNISSTEVAGYVKVEFQPGNHGTLEGTTTYWIKPDVKVTIPEPTVKPNADFRFDGWNKSLTVNLSADSGTYVITAQYSAIPYDPDVDPGLVETQIGKLPTKEDYDKQIKVPGGGSFTVVDIIEQPDVSSKGMKTAKVRIQITNGRKTKTKDADVRVYVVPDPKIIEKPVPGDCNNGCDQPNVGKGALNTTDHYQYLIGYPDGNFAPNKGMTRAEVATMFTRLLKERPVKWKHYNAGLSDIRPGDWYADTVGYAVQKGIVSGYPDGSFKPNKPITRAEFASIASRFDALAQGNAIAFSDLAPSHWGYRAIGSAASKGWISGYPDNTFRPEKAITRAEVTSVTNRMLNRYADLYWIDAHRTEIIRFGDVKRSDWYFEPIMEATMGHDFIRDRDGKTEHWTGVNGKSFI